ncbi:MAG: carbon storage regulator CsrA [Synergistaceae bacterium]|nr:carbon storage regulator CsrA [Synergistaceae bacterium]
MLVLSRKPGEAILIGDDIEISIVEVRGDTVRIGINAPRNITILRQELLAEVAKTNIEAVSTARDAEGILKSLLSGKLKEEGEQK